MIIWFPTGIEVNTYQPLRDAA
ncbi:hypothetical protein THIOKS11650004 [Thiocapsa sp. KS1]|nr:hypothetical protein THIOKS11650004 [Thiocapsa sp. KS1]